ncbi:unnamed protein product, partial [Effrenium voratum]
NISLNRHRCWLATRKRVGVAWVMSTATAEFTAHLDLTGESGLGLEVDWADGKTLLIKNVKAEGAVPSWNKANDAREIRAGDRVLSINGTSGDPKAMLGVCKKEKKLALLVRSGSTQ